MDYVFEDNYTLMSLQELDDFIKKNKHLPNLEAGKYTGNVEIGVLPSLLLEKTEEQALYIIQLQEQITELNEENEQQNKRLERLEKKECIEN